jgi:Fe-S cluster biogenesis protein NfuA
MKFLPGQPVMAEGTLDMPSLEEATHSPLGRRLFAIDGVERVFLGADFITVTKRDDQPWDTLKALILSAIMEHYITGQAVVDDGAATGNAINEDDDDIVVQIKELLNTRVRPAVAQDGGDIVFQKFEDGIVYVHMQGACSGCPSSTATLKAGIENMMRHYIPEVQEVRQTF